MRQDPRFPRFLVSFLASRKGLTAHLRSSLFRNAYYIMAGQAVLGLGSFVFWAIAARFNSAEDVGLASAAVSAVSLLAYISNLGLSFALVRFLPGAGDKSTRMVNSCLSLGAGASVVAGVVFLVGLGFWSPGLLFVRESAVRVACFLVIAVSWNLFTITEQVFVAKRSARFAFGQNSIAAVLKIVLLVVFATFFGAFGVFSAAGVGMIAGLVVALVFFVPRVEKGYLPFPYFQRDTVNTMILYSLANHFAYVIWLLPGLLFPLMVVNTLGAERSAYFYMAWSLALVTSMIPGALTSSLFAEGSHEEGRLSHYSIRSLKMNLLILVPVIALFFAFGGKLLLLFGQEYSENATTLLWVLAAASIPMSINNFYITVMRVRKNMGRVIAVSAAAACLSLGLSYALMKEVGLLGLGIGWLVGQSLVAIVVIGPFVRQDRTPSPGAPAAPAG